ncbi:hypothetical protein [Dokdonella sp.]
MHATPTNVAISTVAIDLAKDVFELAFADMPIASGFSAPGASA